MVTCKWCWHWIGAVSIGQWFLEVIPSPRGRKIDEIGGESLPDSAHSSIISHNMILLTLL